MKIEVVTRRGIGDVLTTYDLINGLTTKSKSFSSNLSDYEISHPEALMHHRGIGYDNFIKELHYMLYGDKIKLNWGTNHNNNVWGAGHAYTTVRNKTLGKCAAYSVFADGAEIKLTWNQCYNYIRYKPIPEICGEGIETGIDSNNYAVITTRCRVPVYPDALKGNPEPFHKELKRFFYYVHPVLEILSDNYEKIVVLGEADENFWDKEKTGTQLEWRNIYDQIMTISRSSSKIGNKIVDLTSNNFSIDQFLTENSIMKRAAKVVCFGHGGNYARAMYTGSNLSCLMGPVGWDHALVYQLRKRKKLLPDTLKHLQLFNDNHIEDFMESLCN